MSKTAKQLLPIIALFGYILLVGCGTKGPLYVPEQRYPQEAQDKASGASPVTKPTSQSTY